MHDCQLAERLKLKDSGQMEITKSCRITKPIFRYTHLYFLEPSYVQEVPDVKFLTWLLFARPMLFQLSWLCIFLLSVTHELSVITTFDDVVFISIRR